MEFSPPVILVFIIFLLLVLLLTGMPVAFAFLAINVFGLYAFLGGHEAWLFLVNSTFEVLTSFEMLAVVFFILMGEALGILGATEILFDTADKVIGFIPARLSFVVVIAGTLFGALSGSSLGAVASIGSTFGVEMRQKGYKNAICLGPIMASGVLDMLIPPSSFAVLLATMAHIPVGKTLMGGIGPGLLLSAMCMIYILIRVLLNPGLAPIDKPAKVSLSAKAKSVMRLLPLGFLFFMVTGTLFLGIATPTEASALGALGAFIVAALYGRLSWHGAVKAVLESGKIISMIFLIMMTSKCFSQFLAGTGIIGVMLETVAAMKISPWLMFALMQFVGIIMGMFIDGFSILMITIPIFIPILKAIGLDPLFFGIMFLINQGIGLLSPPFGMILFVMKGVCPSDVTIEEIYRSAIPYALLILASMFIVALFPQIALWLPSKMAL
jgi:tripartite ATP-independent transporter DctM subunit